MIFNAIVISDYDIEEHNMIYFFEDLDADTLEEKFKKIRKYYKTEILLKPNKRISLALLEKKNQQVKVINEKSIILVNDVLPFINVNFFDKNIKILKSDLDEFKCELEKLGKKKYNFKKNFLKKREKDFLKKYRVQIRKNDYCY
jgi:hypothetical protein